MSEKELDSSVNEYEEENLAIILNNYNGIWLLDFKK